jgi:hypothetical protein
MTATFSEDRALAAARRLLTQSMVLAFRSDAVLHRIDALHLIAELSALLDRRRWRDERH